MIDQPPTAVTDGMVLCDGYFSGHWVIDQSPSAVPDRVFQIDPDFGGNGITYGDVHTRFIGS